MKEYFTRKRTEKELKAIEELLETWQQELHEQWEKEFNSNLLLPLENDMQGGAEPDEEKTEK